MRAWVTYLLGLSLVAIAAFGAYHAYSMNAQQASCGPADHTGGGVATYRRAILRA